MKRAIPYFRAKTRRVTIGSLEKMLSPASLTNARGGGNKDKQFFGLTGLRKVF